MANIFDLFKQIQTGADTARGPVTHIVAGLGNPGEKYVFTRHNAGFMAIDYLTQKLNFKVDRAKFSALVGETEISGRRVLVMKPQTYMNNSGDAVSEAAGFYKVAPEHIIVIQDDIALDSGRMRIRRKGSDGGHNGIKSLIERLGTPEFPRIKLGVGYPPEKDEVINWVLGGIPECDREKFFACLENIPGALELMLGGDIDGKMGKNNK